MQLKMDTEKTNQKFNKNHIKNLLETEYEFITNLFDCFEVPESIEDDTLEEQYLLKSKASDTVKKIPKNASQSAQTPKEEMQQRLEIIANKMRSKKSKPSQRTLKKREQKKLKKTKQLKKKLVSVAKSIKNEKIKEERSVNGTNEDVKPDVKPDIKPEKVFNEEGKIVFSKFEFAARPTQAKKSKKDKTIKHPKLLLNRLKTEKKEIKELMDHGETQKAEEIKKQLAWKRALDKTDGKKVKDNETLLKKTIKRKTVEKKKSKVEWKKRGEKVEKEKETKQKKREANLQKRIDEKRKNKLKKQAKLGRIIPGY